MSAIPLPLTTPTWLDTGLDVPAGGSLVVTGAGKGTQDGVNPCTPDGGLPFAVAGTPLAPGRAPFSLVGYVGPTNPGFGVDAADTVQLGTAPATVSGGAAGGRLWVGFNDLEGSFGDNTGTYSVTAENGAARIAFLAFGPRDEGLLWIEASGAIASAEWDPGAAAYVDGPNRDGGAPMPEGWWESGRLPGSVRRLARAEVEREDFGEVSMTAFTDRLPGGESATALPDARWARFSPRVQGRTHRLRIRVTESSGAVRAVDLVFDELAGPGR